MTSAGSCTLLFDKLVANSCVSFIWSGSFDYMIHETWIPKDCSSAFSVNGWNTE
uniref:Uncharacterized protein n=1 Tax=Aegilops tauschii TaxID=37682 RepID=M8CT31_AEGTA